MPEVLHFLIVALLDRLRPAKRTRYVGNYASWRDAQAASGGDGYADQDILRKICERTHEVVAGRALFERDSVLFHQPSYNWQLLATLWQIRAQLGNKKLVVLDFGGALGSLYFQHREFLEQMGGVRWCVVEQPHYVSCGQAQFQTEQLRFYGSIQSCCEHESVSIAICSSVLGYLPDAAATLKSLMDAQVDTVFIDRTLILDAATTNRVAIQNVPAAIYAARYPVTLFAPHYLTEILEGQYNRLASFDGFEPAAVLVRPWQIARYKGFIFKR